MHPSENPLKRTHQINSIRSTPTTRRIRAIAEIGAGIIIQLSIFQLGIFLSGCQGDSQSSSTASQTITLPDWTQGLANTVTSVPAGPVATPTVTGVTLQSSRLGTIEIALTGSNLTSVNIMQLKPPGELLNVSSNNDIYCQLQRTSSIDATNLIGRPYSDISNFTLNGFSIALFTRDPTVSTSISVTGLGASITYPQNLSSSSALFYVNQSSGHTTSIGASASVVNTKLLIQGKTSTLSSQALRITNSTGLSLLQIRNDGQISIGDLSSPQGQIAVNGTLAVGTSTTNSQLEVTRNTVVSNTLVHNPTATSAPLQFTQLGVNQPSPAAQIDIVASSSAGTYPFSVIASPSANPAAAPSPLFYVRNDGYTGIGLTSPTPFPSSDGPGGLQVNGNIRIDGIGLILGDKTTPLPSCDSDHTNYIALDVVRLLCYCNGSSWYRIGTTTANSCVTYLHSNDDCTAAGGTVQPAPNPPPIGYPSVSFCKFSGSSCPTGWREYQYSTTSQNCNTCPDGCGKGCSGSHPWGVNMTIESWKSCVPEVIGCGDQTATRTEIGCY